jgi:hypothetical protein
MVTDPSTIHGVPQDAAVLACRAMRIETEEWLAALVVPLHDGQPHVEALCRGGTCPYAAEAYLSRVLDLTAQFPGQRIITLRYHPHAWSITEQGMQSFRRVYQEIRRLRLPLENHIILDSRHGVYSLRPYPSVEPRSGSSHSWPTISARIAARMAPRTVSTIHGC